MIYLIGNKIGLPKENRVVSDEEGKKFCLDNNLRDYFEVSAKTGENVDDLFTNIAKELKDVVVDIEEKKNIKLKKTNYIKRKLTSCYHTIINTFKKNE